MTRRYAVSVAGNVLPVIGFGHLREVEGRRGSLRPSTNVLGFPGCGGESDSYFFTPGTEMTRMLSQTELSEVHRTIPILVGRSVN